MAVEDHVKLSDWQGQCLLTVSDWGLYDFLEDLFTDRGFSTQLVAPAGTPQQYQLFFEPGISSTSVLNVLRQMSQEIDRIVQINSTQST